MNSLTQKSLTQQGLDLLAKTTLTRRTAKNIVKACQAAFEADQWMQRPLIVVFKKSKPLEPAN